MFKLPSLWTFPSIVVRQTPLFPSFLIDTSFLPAFLVAAGIHLHFRGSQLIRMQMCSCFAKQTYLILHPGVRSEEERCFALAVPQVHRRALREEFAQDVGVGARGCDVLWLIWLAAWLFGGLINDGVVVIGKLWTPPGFPRDLKNGIEEAVRRNLVQYLCKLQC
jgi:hypothetical protein